MGLSSAGSQCSGHRYRFFSAVLLFGNVHVTYSSWTRAYYLNHFYMISLLSLLMIFIPANRGAFYRRLAENRRSDRADDVPAWARWLLLAQLSIVYFYAGLVAKLNEDWITASRCGAGLPSASTCR
jgi:hypothetical protein